VRQINSSECNHSGHSDGGGSRSGKAEGGVDIAGLLVIVVVVLLVFRSDTVVVVRIAGLLIVVILLTLFVTLFTLFVRLVVFTVLIVSLTLSIFVRLLFGAVVDISGAFGFIFEDIVREFGNRIGVVVLVDGDVGNLVSCLDNSVVTSVGICTSKHS